MIKNEDGTLDKEELEACLSQEAEGDQFHNIRLPKDQMPRVFASFNKNL